MAECVYWDPVSAQRVWQTQIAIVLCPLDLTNNVPVTSALVRQLGKQRQYPHPIWQDNVMR